MNVQVILTELKTQRDRIDEAISALENGRTGGNRLGRPRGKSKRKRVMSAEARAKIAAAAKRRWAAAKKAGNNSLAK